MRTLVLVLLLALPACVAEGAPAATPKYVKGQIVQVRIDGRKAMITGLFPHRDGTTSYLVRVSNAPKTYTTYTFQEFELKPLPEEDQ